MNKNRRYAILGLLSLVIMTSITTVIILSAVGLFLTDIPGIGSISKDDIDFFAKFLAYKNLLKETYYEEVDMKKVYDGALHGMADAVGDQYTMYLEQDENTVLMEDLDSKYTGLGIYVGISAKDNKIVVMDFVDESPAKEAGVEVNDKIIKVDGVEYDGDTLDDAVSHMKGTIGETVKLTILRKDEELEVDVVRREINIKSIEFENKSGIGYIKIVKFDNNVAKSFDEAYDTLRSENIGSLIIDVRDNGGGVYDEVVKIAKRIIPEGLIVYTVDKEGKKEEEKSSGIGIDIPLVVLTNEYSASASEIFAGAVKARGCGTLVGTKTYGKGVVQGVYEMNDGTAMKITIAKYYTPDDVCIDGTGIEPDVLVEDNIRTTKDEQLEKALSILKK
ncbi:MAG: S41 family peptidase [Clostridia bacterium]|nr:S41 family peptidase [Clostridia bacterium]